MIAFGINKDLVTKKVNKSRFTFMSFVEFGKEPRIFFNDVTKYGFEAFYLHNLNGPAVISDDGIKEWFLDGYKMSKVVWLNKRKSFLV